MFDFTWASNYEIVAFFVYLTGALTMLMIALKGTFTCPKKLSQTVPGVLCEMAANGNRSSFREYMTYTLVLGTITYLMHWHLFVAMLIVCNLISFIQGKVFEFRRRRFKIQEQLRKEQTRNEDLE